MHGADTLAERELRARPSIDFTHEKAPTVDWGQAGARNLIGSAILAWIFFLGGGGQILAIWLRTLGISRCCGDKLLDELKQSRAEIVRRGYGDAPLVVAVDGVANADC
jgi:hypothetical protein